MKRTGWWFILVLAVACVLFGANYLRPDAKKTEKQETFVVIVPHHDVVKSKRLEFWGKLLTDFEDIGNIGRMVIVGPDHFGSNQSVISYDDTGFTTFDGVLANFFQRPDYFGKNVVKNTTLVKDDHAVSSLLAELHESFPNAEIAPFLIGQSVKFEETEVLIRFLKTDCQDCLIVASVDFSHYLEFGEAEEKTSEALRQLEDMAVSENSLGIPDNTDCPACLFVVQEVARYKELNFELFFRDNYGVGTERTTHLIGIYKR